MGKIIVCLAISLGFITANCDKENDSAQKKEYQFEATIIGKGLDCGDTYLIELNKLINNSEIVNGVYYADNLPSELKVNGLKIILNCRIPIDNELYACTTLGIPYPHVVIIDSERENE